MQLSMLPHLPRRSVLLYTFPTPPPTHPRLAALQELEESPLTGAPPPEPTDAQKLASLAVFTELLVGFLFALGLGVSGMVRPSKVTAFLAVISGEWAARGACRGLDGGLWQVAVGCEFRPWCWSGGLGA